MKNVILILSIFSANDFSLIVERLNHDDYSVRKAAQKELTKISSRKDLELMRKLSNDRSLPLETRLVLSRTYKDYYAPIFEQRLTIWYLPDRIRFKDGKDIAAEYYKKVYKDKIDEFKSFIENNYGSYEYYGYSFDKNDVYYNIQDFMDYSMRDFLLDYIKSNGKKATLQLIEECDNAFRKQERLYNNYHFIYTENIKFLTYLDKPPPTLKDRLKNKQVIIPYAEWMYDE